jgi:hypothetical protein
MYLADYIAERPVLTDSETIGWLQHSILDYLGYRAPEQPLSLRIEVLTDSGIIETQFADTSQSVLTERRVVTALQAHHMKKVIDRWKGESK